MDLPVDMDPLLKIAKKYKIKVIEDAAEVLGLKYKNKPNVVVLVMSLLLVFTPTNISPRAREE